MPHSIKELFAKNELVKAFSIGRLVHPVIIDMYGFVGGYHALWLDQEHCGLTYEQIVLATCAARANGFDTFVRMAPTNYAEVTQNLEAGSKGVMAARIDSASHAQEFVNWTKFPQTGNRGMNNCGYDGQYSFLSAGEFAPLANQQNTVGIQIETLGALQDVEAIAAIAGVDYLFLGPTDMSAALGHVGQLNHPSVWEAVSKISAACRKHGKHWATIAVDPAFSARAYDQGCRMLTFSTDVRTFRTGLEATKTQFADFFGK